MADDDPDMEVGPTCTAEELAAQRYEAAKAKGDVLELSSDDEDEPPASRRRRGDPGFDDVTFGADGRARDTHTQRKRRQIVISDDDELRGGGGGGGLRHAAAQEAPLDARARRDRGPAQGPLPGSGPQGWGDQGRAAFAADEPVGGGPGRLPRPAALESQREDSVLRGRSARVEKPVRPEPGYGGFAAAMSQHRAAEAQHRAAEAQHRALMAQSRQMERMLGALPW